MYGAPEGIRTPDRSVRSRVLYPAELQAHKLSLLGEDALSRFIPGTSIYMAEKEGLLRASCPSPFWVIRKKTADVKNCSRQFFRTMLLTRCTLSSIFLKIHQKTHWRIFKNMAEKEGFEPSIEL